MVRSGIHQQGGVQLMRNLVHKALRVQEVTACLSSSFNHRAGKDVSFPPQVEQLPCSSPVQTGTGYSHCLTGGLGPYFRDQLFNGIHQLPSLLFGVSKGIPNTCEIFLTFCQPGGLLASLGFE